MLGVCPITPYIQEQRLELERSFVDRQRGSVVLARRVWWGRLFPFLSLSLFECQVDLCYHYSNLVPSTTRTRWCWRGFHRVATSGLFLLLRDKNLEHSRANSERVPSTAPFFSHTHTLSLTNTSAFCDMSLVRIKASGVYRGSWGPDICISTELVPRRKWQSAPHVSPPTRRQLSSTRYGIREPPKALNSRHKWRTFGPKKGPSFISHDRVMNKSFFFLSWGR